MAVPQKVAVTARMTEWKSRSSSTVLGQVTQGGMGRSRAKKGGRLMHCKQNGLNRVVGGAADGRSLWPRMSLPVINLHRIIDAWRWNEKNAFIHQTNQLRRQRSILYVGFTVHYFMYIFLFFFTGNKLVCSAADLLTAATVFRTKWYTCADKRWVVCTTEVLLTRVLCWRFHFVNWRPYRRYIT